MRVSMFKSWGIKAVDGMPGVTLNSLVFYVIRFSVPIVGVLLLLGEGLAGSRIWLAVGSLIVACLMVAGLVLVSRGERAARLVGTKVARVVSRFRDGVDPEAWGRRSRRSATLDVDAARPRAPAVAASLFAMVLVDGLIVLLSLRMVGVPGSLVPPLLVLGTFLVVYPFTALPLAGLGVLDAALVVAFTEVAGVAYEPEIVAGLALWRVVTILGALVLGCLDVRLVAVADLDGAARGRRHHRRLTRLARPGVPSSHAEVSEGAAAVHRERRPTGEAPGPATTDRSSGVTRSPMTRWPRIPIGPGQRQEPLVSDEQPEPARDRERLAELLVEHRGPGRGEVALGVAAAEQLGREPAGLQPVVDALAVERVHAGRGVADQHPVRPGHPGHRAAHRQQRRQPGRGSPSKPHSSRRSDV